MLARCFLSLDRESEAIAVIRECQNFESASVDVMISLGNLALYLQQLDEASRIFQSAMRTDPQNGAVHLGLGRVLVSRGEIEAAQAQFFRALDLEPTLPGVALHLSRSHRFTTEDNNTIAYLDSLRRHPGMSTSAMADLHFALGKISDDCSRFDLAFEHYEEANRLVSKTLSFDRQKFTRSVDLLCLSFSSIFFDTHTNVGQNSQIPIFIVGMPRSGTTLVEQILASHSEVHGAGELSYIDRLSNELAAPVSYPRAVIGMDGLLAYELSERYLQKVAALSPKATRIADKMPTNLFHLGFIASLFPQAHIIHCRRDPLDTCLSIYFQQFETGHEWAYDLGNIAFFYNGYQRIMAHWEKVLPLSIHEVHYESLVSCPEETSRKMVAHCGLSWESSCLDFHQQGGTVMTSSAWQVRQPLYSRSVGRCRLYETHLDSLRRELEIP